MCEDREKKWETGREREREREKERGKEKWKGLQIGFTSLQRQILGWFSSQENETCRVLKIAGNGSSWLHRLTTRLEFRKFPCHLAPLKIFMKSRKDLFFELLLEMLEWMGSRIINININIGKYRRYYWTVCGSLLSFAKFQITIDFFLRW